MTQRQDDEGLRKDFQRLRSETEAVSRAPDFRAMIDRAKAEAEAAPDLRVVAGGRTRATRRRRVLEIGGWGAAAVAAAITTILLVGEGDDADREFDRLVAAYSADVATGAWRSPTSGLLDVPGMNLTRTVPSFGTSLRGLDPDQRPDAPEGRDS